MYSQRELTKLAATKAALRTRISRRRAECAAAAARMAQPLAWLDQGITWWRQHSPVMKAGALALGCMLSRSAARRRGALGTLLRWGPLVLGAVRSLAGTRVRSGDR